MFPRIINPYTQELIDNARRIATRGKGILAADEDNDTMQNRFKAINLQNNYENRQAYRTLLLKTPGIGQYLSGVILYQETLENRDLDGIKLLQHIQNEGILPGIKVDTGLVSIPGTDGETATQGIDGLSARCQKFYEVGCRFAKWRAAYRISGTCPSQIAITENAHTLARYAKISQANGLVPIIEPDVLSDGDHSIDICAQKSQEIYAAVVKALQDQGVLLEGSLLKPNMITSGQAAVEKAGPGDVAWRTVQILGRTIPVAIPGIMFLSGGQSEEEASLNLSAINAIPNVQRPWTLSFCYGRALQASTIRTWQGRPENIEAARAVFMARIEANSKAQLGNYKGGTGGTDAQGSLFVSNYVY